MTSNAEVAWLFLEIGDLLELKGDSPFKVRAYRQAARTLEKLPVSVEVLVAEQRLEEVPGIGKALAAKIGEILATGRSAYLEGLRQEIPAGLREMLAIPGLGVKSVRTIYQGLRIATLEDLEKAAREREIRKLPGLGSKTELNILRGLEMLRAQEGHVPLGVAWVVAEGLQASLLSLGEVTAALVAGEVRRGVPLVGAIELVAASREPVRVGEIFARYPRWREVRHLSRDRLEGVANPGVKVILYLVPPEDLSREMFLRTGSAAHCRRLAEVAREAGWNDFPGRLAEEEIYARLGLAYIPPELREGRGEIEAAAAGTLPRLVEAGDIRGDLHVHSNWSDGVDALRTIAEAARKQGYRYLAITDHSRSLAVARGLPVEKVWEQGRAIRALNEELADIRLLWGTEVDILADGTLDYPDEVLAEMDWVIASVHTSFKQDEETMTARIARAIRHPLVRVLGHPTGRILGRRSPYAVDLPKILAAAAETGTCVELNASGDRLDLEAEGLELARDLGVKVAIGTDSHESRHLEDMRYGLITARRGWLRPDDVVNTREWEEMGGR
ncbi:MAG: DNA polymerase/3'-5' exonuclease PolX [Clostridia bacterium]|nr:MAG: DNA polymerase/3'-5' exonuclease PolX [Clostridia bacterium]